MPSKTSCDIAIVGGGLSGSLIALALNARHRDLDIRLIEGSPVIGGDHIWTFFGGDVAPEHRWLIAPAVAHLWRGHDVALNAHSRRLDGRYYAILSETLDHHVRATLPAKALMTERRVAALTRTSVVLAGGDRIRAQGVIDVRGAADLSALDLGWRKFLGQELELAEPHRCDRPMAMDAKIAQNGGYRFVQTLPFGEERIFVGDASYGDAPGIDSARLRGRIADYAGARGWRVEHVVREHMGALPICMGGDFERYWNAGGTQVPKAGLRAGLFHPTTGHSLPDAVETAIMVAGLPDFEGESLHDRLFEHARHAWRRRGFHRMLNRLLFRAATPDERHRMIERFYRLDPGVISRFYAGRSTPVDKFRMLSGKPPMSIGRLMGAIREKRA